MVGGFLLSRTDRPTGMYLDHSTPKNWTSLPSLKLTFSHLKMDGWNTIVSFWDGPFSGAFAVSFREGKYPDPSKAWRFWGPKHPCYTGSFTLPLEGPWWSLGMIETKPADFQSGLFQKDEESRVHFSGKDMATCYFSRNSSKTKIVHHMSPSTKIQTYLAPLGRICCHEGRVLTTELPTIDPRKNQWKFINQWIGTTNKHQRIR